VFAFLVAVRIADPIVSLPPYQFARHRFDKTIAYPVLLALPPGDQSKELVAAGLRLYWEAQAKKRGCVVISPAAPEGTSFYYYLNLLV
jgi:hypothetical protein